MDKKYSGLIYLEHMLFDPLHFLITKFNKIKSVITILLIKKNVVSGVRIHDL